MTAERQSAPTFVRLAKQFKKEAARNLLLPSLSYDSVVILPGPSQVATLDAISTQTELVKGIPMAIPIISANMDTVTEAPMATFMARVGGIGIIHRAMSIEDEVAQVRQVKNATRYVVDDPPRIQTTDSVGRARYLMEENKRGYALVFDDKDQLAGIVTSRDVVEHVPNDRVVSDNVMTPRDKLIVAPPNISIQDAMRMLYEARVEKLPLVDELGNVGGVVTERDLSELLFKYPHATKDSRGRLRVGAAIGVEAGSLERAQELIRAGVDVIVVDVLHGDTQAVREMVKSVKSLSPSVPVIAGNVAGGDATKRLINIGVDSIKVGYGDGALCTTRVQTGTGRGQFSAVVESAAAAYGLGVTIIADGSIRSGGDLAKGLAAGAQTVMVGTGLAGTDQSPGEIIRDDRTGDRYKVAKGMASKEAQKKLAEARGVKAKKRTAQGISTRVNYIGDAGQVIDDLVGGLTSGMANSGGIDIKSFQQNVVFERQDAATHAEGMPHVLTSGRVR